MAVTSIMVAGLKTRTRWVDYFIVCLYADAALTKLLSVQGSHGNWDGTYNNQAVPIRFPNLTHGSTYWVRVGVQCPANGQTTWSNAYAKQAGTTSDLAAVTYFQMSGSPSWTAGGVDLWVGVNNAPSNLDRFEFVWTLENTAPPDSHEPMAKRSLRADNTFTLHLGIPPGRTYWLWIRACDTRHNFQSWQFGGYYTCGTADHVNPGGTYTVIRKTATDNNGNIDPRVSGFIKLGSVNPAWTGQINYGVSADSTGAAWVTWTWPQLTIRLIDGSTVTVNANTSGYTVGGLQSSHTYYFYPWVDAFSNPGRVGFVGGGIGTDGVAHTFKASAFDQSQSLQNHIPLSPGAITITTPAAPASGTSGGTGSGGGSGGGGTGGGVYDGCPRYGQKVIAMMKGIIPIEQVEIGDFLLGENDTWLRVNELYHESETEFLRLTTHRGEVVEHSPHTEMKLADGTIKKTCDLSMNDVIVTRGPDGESRLGRIMKIELIDEQVEGDPPMMKVVLNIDSPHFFWCGTNAPDILAHNLMATK